MLSITKSREILGKEYENCSDEEIQKIINSAYFFADIFLEGIIDAREVVNNVDNINKLNNKK